jgi:hypothetical protein
MTHLFSGLQTKFSRLQTKFLFFLFMIFSVTLLFHIFFLAPTIRTREMMDHIAVQGQLTQDLQTMLDDSFKNSVKEIEARSALVKKPGWPEATLIRFWANWMPLPRFLIIISSPILKGNGFPGHPAPAWWGSGAITGTGSRKPWPERVTVYCMYTWLKGRGSW